MGFLDYRVRGRILHQRGTDRAPGLLCEQAVTTHSKGIRAPSRLRTANAEMVNPFLVNSTSRLSSAIRSREIRVAALIRSRLTPGFGASTLRGVGGFLR
jgi:hypothetical protein